MHRGMEQFSDQGRPMDPDKLKGAINEIAGRAKRQVGEWTGDTNAQVEGLAQEVKGKAQQAWSGVKSALRSAKQDLESAHARAEAEILAEQQGQQAQKDEF